jgi:hypothetical protein
MQPKPYLSASELGRKANVSQRRIITAVKTGKLQPDFVIGRIQAFKLERVPALIKTLTAENAH